MSFCTKKYAQPLKFFRMQKLLFCLIFFSCIFLTLTSCAGQHPPNTPTTDSLATKNISQTDDLTKIYIQAISDYITEVSKQNLLVLDTLYIGKRINGQPDDFPNISLPETINNIAIRLIKPEEGEKLQKEKKSSIYLNLIGWVDPDKAEFIFVTFSNGFEHKFDCYLSYQ